VTDGGEVSPADIADSGGFHRDSVYRALDEMEEMIEHEYDSISLRSTHVGELVHDAVQQARESTQRAVEAGAKALEAAERGLDDQTSALVSWAAQYCEGGLRERDDGVTLDFGTIQADSRKDAREQVKRMLREGTRLWREARNDEIQWRMGTWRAVYEYPPDTLERRLGYTDSDRTKRDVRSGKIWREMTTW
jgi:hypothetical protein